VTGQARDAAFRLRLDRFGGGRFALLLGRPSWFYFSNKTYPGERRFYLRIGRTTGLPRTVWFGGTRG